jgi:glycosyltransferase 2 family protein
MDERALQRLGRVARVVAPPVFIALLLWRVDVRSIGAHLARLDLRFVGAFLAVSVLLYAVCAWRWSFTASRLGVGLPLRRAVLDYYLSTLLNQVLPVGVAGDVVRAARHRRRAGAAWGPPVRAVVLERLSGTLALALVVAASAVVWLARGERAFLAVVASVALIVGLTAWVLSGRVRPPSILARLVADARAALVETGALGIQLAASLASVALLLVMFACAAAAVGVSLDAAATFRLVPLVLATTTIPWAFAGWGPRELSAAALFGLDGLEPAAGAAASVAFGLLSLVAATPGLFVLLLPQRDPEEKTR